MDDDIKCFEKVYGYKQFKRICLRQKKKAEKTAMSFYKGYITG